MKGSAVTVKKILLCALCLILALSMPVLCFAEGETADENTVMEVINIIWYVVLVVLFGGGLILVSKWSQKINARDAELEAQLLELQQAEDEQEEQDAAMESSDSEKEPENSTDGE